MLRGSRTWKERSKVCVETHLIETPLSIGVAVYWVGFRFKSGPICSQFSIPGTPLYL